MEEVDHHIFVTIIIGRDHYIGFLNNGIPKDKVQYKAGYYEIGSMRKY